MKTKNEVLALIKNAEVAHSAIRECGIISVTKDDVHCETKECFLTLNENRALKVDIQNDNFHTMWIYGKDSEGRTITYVV